MSSSVFHTLNLRDSAAKKEKQMTERLQEQSRKRQNMRDLLVQNFMKKYTQKLDMHGTTTSQISVLIAKVISHEVE